MNEKLKQALSFILDKLSENSTWRGIILTLTGLGVGIEPENGLKIMAAGVGIVGVINIFRQGAPTKTQVAKALDAKQDK
jgi:hypothetical protein